MCSSGQPSPFPRFAPHLEKCLGMGRNSSRIASRRIQNSTKDNSGHHHSSAAASDDDDDDDWLVDRKRKKRDKNSPRRSKNAKVCAAAWLVDALLKFCVLSVCWNWMQMGFCFFSFFNLFTLSCSYRVTVTTRE